MSSQEWSRRFEIHCEARGITGDGPRPFDPQDADLTPGVYVATMEKFDFDKCQVHVTYVAKDGDDHHRVWMPPSLFDQLVQIRQDGQHQCQLVVRHDSRAMLFPLGMRVPEEYLAAS